MTADLSAFLIGAISDLLKQTATFIFGIELDGSASVVGRLTPFRKELFCWDVIWKLHDNCFSGSGTVTQLDGC